LLRKNLPGAKTALFSYEFMDISDLGWWFGR